MSDIKINRLLEHRNIMKKRHYHEDVENIYARANELLNSKRSLGKQK